MNEINPDQVPPFPVYALEYDGSTVMLDKVIVEPAPGQEVTEAGVEAVARKAREAGLEAVRVRVATPDGDHLMVVGSEGEAVDITPSTAPDQPSRRKRLLIIAAAMAVLLVLSVGGIGIGMAIKEANTEPVAAPAPPIPGADTPIPVALPNGFADHAAWTVPIADRAEPVALNDNSVLITTPQGGLEIREPERATTVWSSSSAPRGSTPVVETTWTGRPVLAAASGSTMTLWPLDLPDTKDVPSAEIEIDTQAEITYAGVAPLLDLGDYTVAVPAEKGVQRVNVPPGTQPVAAGDDIIVSIGDNVIARTAFTEQAANSTTNFNRPKGTKGAPTNAIGLTPTRALVTWEVDNSDLTALIDTETGKVLDTQTGKAPDSRDLPQIDDNEGTALLGSYFIRLAGSDPQLFDLDLTSRDAVLDGSHVYTANTDGPLELTISGDKVVPGQWTPLSPDEPLPSAVSDNSAYVVAEKVDQSILYRAPRHNQEEAQ